MKQTLLLLLCLIIAGPTSAQAHDHSTTKPTSQPARKPWAPRSDCSGTYGQVTKTPFTNVKLSALLKNPTKYRAKLVRVQGVVKDVCRKKGCWLLLGDGKRVMRIRFKGYSFFVPVNSKGYRVSVYGFAKKTTISEKMAKHYAEESGDKAAVKRIKGPQKTVAFTADWVELSKAKR